MTFFFLHIASVIGDYSGEGHVTYLHTVFGLIVLAWIIYFNFYTVLYNIVMKQQVSNPRHSSPRSGTLSTVPQKHSAYKPRVVTQQ